ncbi:MAG TPA: PRC-barrel domain-containing protein, partial [Herpetosiphonaceae bacterium]
MRKAADLLKKLIVQIDTGDIVGKVEDLLLDPEQDRLAALITMSGRWMREAALIPWEGIVVCTGDVILVRPGTEPQPASALPPLQQLLERNIHVSGTRVLTASGDKVGTVGEMLIDGEGRIKGYTISRGFLGAERQFVAAEDVEAIGADALIVRDDAARDTLDDEPPASGYPADERRPEIVLPLTGTRIPAPLPPFHEPPPAAEPEPAPGGFAAYTGPTIFAERPEDPAPEPEPAVLA